MGVEPGFEFLLGDRAFLVEPDEWLCGCSANQKEAHAEPYKADHSLLWHNASANRNQVISALEYRQSKGERSIRLGDTLSSR